jgi:hypothetical protein
LSLQLRTAEEQAKASKRLIKRQNDRKRKLEELGISYNFDAVGYVRLITFYLQLFDGSTNLMFRKNLLLPLHDYC